MKTVIAGSRAFDDYGYLCVVCDMIDISEIVSGTARRKSYRFASSW